MSTGERIAKLRKEHNLTQENLADYLNVSRQSISKWEQDLSYPETDKLIKLAELFNVSVDYLLRGKTNNHNDYILIRNSYHYEYKSKKTFLGLPLIHVNFGNRFYKARGIIAIGNISQGIISLGFFSFGLISLGLVSLGLLALGTLAIGSMAFGAICLGIFSLGSISIGLFSVGALSIGKYIAIGDYSIGDIAIGFTHVNGKVLSILGHNYDKEIIRNTIDSYIPKIWLIFKEICKLFI